MLPEMVVMKAFELPSLTSRMPLITTFAEMVDHELLELLAKFCNVARPMLLLNVSVLFACWPAAAAMM